MKELSELFQGACQRMHTATTNLYEVLHGDDGLPITDKELVASKITEWRQGVNIEVDLIRQSVRAHEEYFGQKPK